MDAPVETRTFAVSSDDIGLIDGWIEMVGACWGESKRTIFAARLCIAELAANVLEHGVATTESDHITITLRHSDDGIGIEFVDSRGPFDPTCLRTTQSAAGLHSVPGGRGLRLLHAYADDLSYRNDGKYNRVTLKITSK